MNTQTEKELMYERIKKHGDNLLTEFPFARPQDPIELCKKLRRLELKASKLAEEYCNGDCNCQEFDTKSDVILNRVNEILGANDAEIFVNGDPRGYALKVPDNVMRENEIEIYRDMGGYGIIAPDLS